MPESEYCLTISKSSRLIISDMSDLVLASFEPSKDSSLFRSIIGVFLNEK